MNSPDVYLHRPKVLSTLRPISAKHSKSRPANPRPAEPAAASAAGAAAQTGTAEAPVSFLDSPDPRKRLIGKIALVAIWVYVAALWLLALDQTFHWGIFGPKVEVSAPPKP